MRTTLYVSGLGLAMLAGCWSSRSPLTCKEVADDRQIGAAPTQTCIAPREPDLVDRNGQTQTEEALPENPFKKTEGEDTTSTFAVDVDTASYSIVRSYLRRSAMPPASVVRVEEMLNRFDISDPAAPTDGRAFATRIEVAECPWKPKDRLVRIALRGREVDETKRPPTNLVFLIDVSGSMGSPERLPLLKQALRLLVERLGEKDKVAMVVYAGASGVALKPTNGSNRAKILEALDRLEAGGSTNGGAGIELAYNTAVEGFIEGGANRVILCTDGDFNVGVSSVAALEELIEKKKKTGVFLSALGFGVGSHGDRVMETLADKGNGHYAAIEDLKEAKRVLVTELTGTLVTIAKDVKVQVEWNPERVKRYRLVGYENRVMANKDFKDDKKDGGEIGAGHRVTALYEVEAEDSDAPLCTLRLRWKAPDSETSTGAEAVARGASRSFEEASPDMKFAASVAAGAMLLRKSTHAGEATWAKAIRWGSEGLGQDRHGDRAEWLDLLRRAAELTGQSNRQDG